MEAIGGFKVWAAGDSEWYVATSRDEAIAEMCEVHGCADEQELLEEQLLDADGFIELTDEDMDRLVYVEEADEDGNPEVRRSFREQLVNEVAKGGLVFPAGQFASTEF